MEQVGLVQELAAAARRAPPLVATRAVAGGRFTAVAAAPEAKGAAVVAGAAFTGSEDAPDFDPVRSSTAADRLVRGRRVADLLGAIEATGHAPGHHPPGTAGGPASVPLEQAAGIAALNAALAAALVQRGTTLGDENGLDLIARLGTGKHLAVVGAFPYLKTIRLEAARSWVLELDPSEDELPAAAAPEILPQADVVGITGSTLANGTLEALLRLCRRDAFVAVIGPTTPLSPILFDYGVDVLCGTLADDPDEMLDAILAGGSTRRIPGTRQVSLRASRARSR
jgi:hypothetical protein